MKRTLGLLDIASALLSLIGILAPIRADAENVIVPVVECSGNIQGHPTAPRGAPKSAQVNIPPSLASEVALYVSSTFQGILAPRNFDCGEYGGSNGAGLVVWPKIPRATIDARGTTAEFVSVRIAHGFTSGRCEAASIAGVLFPAARSFVRDVASMNLCGSEPFRTTPFDGEKIEYLSDKLVRFFDPPFVSGVGTGSPTNRPVQGIAELIADRVDGRETGTFSVVTSKSRFAEARQHLADPLGNYLLSQSSLCPSSKFRPCAGPPIAAVAPSNVAPRPQPPAAPQTQEKSSGTGFYVSSVGHLITNYHVIEGCKTLAIADAGGARPPVRVIRSSKPDDLALLHASVAPSAIATFRGSSRIQQGETIVAYGYPLAGILASSGNVSTGLVTALAGLGDDPRQIQISAPVQPGNSGGPLVDTKGAIVGVIVSKLDALKIAKLTDDIPQNINFAIKMSSVINLLDASAVRYQVSTSEREQGIAEITQQMRAYTVRVECN